jgi:hypothetical protein
VCVSVGIAKGHVHAGTRTASVAADCARCVPNAPLLVGIVYCEAKIALSNSLAVLGVFSLAYNRGKYGAPMHLFLSLFRPPELHCFAHLIYIVPTMLLLAQCCTVDLQPHSYMMSPVLHCTATVHAVLEIIYKVASTVH